MRPILFVRGAVGNYQPIPQKNMLDAVIEARQFRQDGYDVYICYGVRASELPGMDNMDLVRKMISGGANAAITC